MIRKIEKQEERVESGPIQFGDDWPGYFIRGDQAFALRAALESTLRGEEDFITNAQIQSFIEDLDKCFVDKA
jgi:hypothetical protein